MTRRTAPFNSSGFQTVGWAGTTTIDGMRPVSSQSSPDQTSRYGRNEGSEGRAREGKGKGGREEKRKAGGRVE
jgi:hypothetical protein